MDFSEIYKECLKIGHDWVVLDKDGLQCSKCNCFKMRIDRIPHGCNPRAEEFYKRKFDLC